MKAEKIILIEKGTVLLFYNFFLKISNPSKFFIALFENISNLFSISPLKNETLQSKIFSTFYKIITLSISIVFLIDFLFS